MTGMTRVTGVTRMALLAGFAGLAGLAVGLHFGDNTSLSVTSLSDPFGDLDPDQVPVFAISLDPDRRARLLRNLPSVNVIQGVDGRELPPTGTGMTRGEMGCFLSHVKAWEAVAGCGADFAIVLEDDAIFDEKMLRTVRERVSNAPVGWDLVFLGLNNPSNESLVVARGIRAIDHDTYGLHAVALSASGAKKLLRAFEQLGVSDGRGSTTCPVDVWVSRIPDVRAYRVDPLCVTVHDLRDSSTQKIR